jgi:hypothetical protein
MVSNKSNFGGFGSNTKHVYREIVKEREEREKSDRELSNAMANRPKSKYVTVIGTGLTNQDLIDYDLPFTTESQITVHFSDANKYVYSVKHVVGNDQVYSKIVISSTENYNKFYFEDVKETFYKIIKKSEKLIYSSDPTRMRSMETKFALSDLTKKDCIDFIGQYKKEFDGVNIISVLVHDVERMEYEKNCPDKEKWKISDDGYDRRELQVDQE